MAAVSVSGAARLVGEDQAKLAEEANANVKKQAFFMKRALDDNKLQEAMRSATNMLSGLRSSKLSPQSYYELYISITDELRHLEAFIEEDSKPWEDGKEKPSVNLPELYESVQHCGNIVPRMYLLITVGGVYIKNKGAPAMEILFDLFEMTKGVQHPMRGLFLRNYLSQISRDKLPDALPVEGEPSEAPHGAIDFILQNFCEMTRLWVRMQHQGAVRDTGRREKERQNLRMLVGTNLVRLSQLQAVDKATYASKGLPRILDNIIRCKDKIAQEYLMDCIIQVFPDDYHLETLDIFLKAVTKLQPFVNVKDIIVALMNRLAGFVLEDPDNVPDDLDMFLMFQKYSSEVIEKNEKMSLKDVLSIQVALVDFASKLYPEKLVYIDRVLGFSVEVLHKNAEAGEDNLGPAGVQVMKLLTTPLETVLLQVLELSHFADLLKYLDFPLQRKVSTSILRHLLKGNNKLSTPEMVRRLLDFISPLVEDQDKTPPLTDDNRFEFEEEQYLVARFVDTIYSDDTDLQFKSLNITRKEFRSGGADRLVHTLPAVVSSALQLTRQIYKCEQQGVEVSTGSKRLFQFMHEAITSLTQHDANVALRLFLQGGLLADELGYEPIAYEFIVQALLIYEEEISDSNEQYRAINLVTATLQSSKNFETDNYETLSTKATQHSSKLLKKPEQARAVYTCAHLFWHPSEDGFRVSKSVLHCLQRSLKIANVIMEELKKVHIFIEILNKYVYFFENGCDTIKPEFLSNLIALIEEHFSGLDPDMHTPESIDEAKEHYRRTIEYIRVKQQTDDVTVALKFSQITLL
eukprot:56903_1